MVNRKLATEEDVYYTLQPKLAILILIFIIA